MTLKIHYLGQGLEGQFLFLLLYQLFPWADFFYCLVLFS